MSKSARDFSGRLPAHLRPVSESVQPDVATVVAGRPVPTLDDQNERTMRRFRELQAQRPAAVNIPKAKFPLPDAAKAQAELEASRRVLADCIKVCGMREREHAEAGRRLQVGREAVADLQGRLEAADAVDADVAEFLAAHTGEELPVELAEKRAERDRLRQKAADTVAACGVLEQHHAAAQAALRAAETTTRDAVQDTLAAHLEGMAAALLDAEREAVALRREIVDATDAGIRPTVATKQALLECRPHADRSAPIERQQRLARWRDLMRRLERDADADIAVDG